MIYSSFKSLSDKLLELLAVKEATALELHASVLRSGSSVTIQAVYKSLRQMVADSIVVKNKQGYALSREWVSRITRELGGSNDVLSILSGESVKYSFVSLKSLDAFWKHLMKMLDISFVGCPVFIYNPYCVWLHVESRYNSEVSYLRNFELEKKHCFLSIGNKTSLDRGIKVRFQNDYLQISNSTPPTFSHDYISVVGDFILTTKLGSKLNKAIAAAYTKKELGIEELLKSINTTLQDKGKYWLLLEKDEKKAAFYRNKLAKNFYIPKDIKSAYKLG